MSKPASSSHHPSVWILFHQLTVLSQSQSNNTNVTSMSSNICQVSEPPSHTCLRIAHHVLVSKPVIDIYLRRPASVCLFMSGRVHRPKVTAKPCLMLCLRLVGSHSRPSPTHSVLPLRIPLLMQSTNSLLEKNHPGPSVFSCLFHYKLPTL